MIYHFKSIIKMSKTLVLIMQETFLKQAVNGKLKDVNSTYQLVNFVKGKTSIPIRNDEKCQTGGVSKYKTDLAKLRYTDVLLTLWYFKRNFEVDSNIHYQLLECITFLTMRLDQKSFAHSCNILTRRLKYGDMAGPYEYIDRAAFVFPVVRSNFGGKELTKDQLIKEYLRIVSDIIATAGLATNTETSTPSNEAKTTADVKCEMPTDDDEHNNIKKRMPNTRDKNDERMKVSPDRSFFLIDKPIATNTKSFGKLLKAQRKKQLAKSIIIGSRKLFANTWCGSSGPPDSIPVSELIHSKLRNVDVEYGSLRVCQGVLHWTVPADGEYNISAMGASNISDSKRCKEMNWPKILSRGAVVTGDFQLNKGDKLEIILGQPGTDPSCGCGGTFVNHNVNGTRELIIAAGGAGGVASFEERGVLSNGSTSVYGHASDVSKDLIQSVGGAGVKSDRATGGSGIVEQSSGFENLLFGAMTYKDRFLGSRPIRDTPLHSTKKQIRNKEIKVLHGGFGGGGAPWPDNIGAGGGGGYSGGHGGINFGGGGGSYSKDGNAIIDVATSLDIQNGARSTGLCTILPVKPHLDCNSDASGNRLNKNHMKRYYCAHPAHKPDNEVILKKLKIDENYTSSDNEYIVTSSLPC